MENVYERISVNLTTVNMSRLVKSASIMMPRSIVINQTDLVGDHTMYLTEDQAHRVRQCRRHKTSLPLNLSGAQIQAMYRHGLLTEDV